MLTLSFADPGIYFARICDGYPRFLFTLDPLLQEREGVRHLNMVDFMSDEAELLEPR